MEGVGGRVRGRELFSSVVWPMVSCHLCGNRPTPGLMQEALIKLSGQFNRARGRGRGLMARLEKQTKQPGRLSQSPADKLTHFILARGPSHQVSTPPALTSTSGLREGQSQLPSQSRVGWISDVPSRPRILLLTLKSRIPGDCWVMLILNDNALKYLL